MLMRIGVLGGALAAMVGLGEIGPAAAANVDLTAPLQLNGMSEGTCPHGVCGTVKVTGNTDSSLTYTIDLAQGVSFYGDHGDRADFFYFELTGGTSITFSDISAGGTGYTFGAIASGNFKPNTRIFPGPYDYAATCTTSRSGDLCGSTFSFTANGGSDADPLVIGAPLGHGLFKNDPVFFVASLSVSEDCGVGCTCHEGTGLVGAPEPSTWAMMALGFAGLGFAGWRKARSGKTALFA